MNHLNTHQRSLELEKLAAQLGSELPAYPTAEQVDIVAREIVKQSRCQPSSAIHAIVAGVLRPKRKAGQA